MCKHVLEASRSARAGVIHMRLASSVLHMFNFACLIRVDTKTLMVVSSAYRPRVHATRLVLRTQYACGRVGTLTEAEAKL